MYNVLRNCTAVQKGKLCEDCNLDGYGYCIFNEVQPVTREELTREFVRDARNTAYGLSLEFGLDGDKWVDQLVNWYQSLPFRFVAIDQDGMKREVFLATGWLQVDPPQDRNANPDTIETSENLRCWYARNFCRPCNSLPYVTKAERLIVAFSIIRAKFGPSRCGHWGK